LAIYWFFPLFSRANPQPTGQTKLLLQIGAGTSHHDKADHKTGNNQSVTTKVVLCNQFHT